MLFLHLGHIPLLSHFVSHSVIAFSVPQAAKCCSSCFCSLTTGRWVCLKGLLQLLCEKDSYLPTGGYNRVLSLWARLGLTGQLCTQEDFKQPVCWYMRPFTHPVGCLTWDIPALEPTGSWVGPGLHEKTAASLRPYVNEYTPVPLLQVSLCLQWATVVSLLLQEILQY